MEFNYFKKYRELNIYIYEGCLEVFLIASRGMSMYMMSLNYRLLGIDVDGLSFDTGLSWHNFYLCVSALISCFPYATKSKW